MGTVAGSSHSHDVVSHGICERCVDNLTFQAGVPLQQYLDSIPVPVLAMDSNIIVQAVNAQGCEILGKKQREVVQHLGGNVFECAHARLPEGCGRTVHCSGCAIRRSVLRTYETGEPLSLVPATLSRSALHVPCAVELTITTIKAGNIVFLRVDRLEQEVLQAQRHDAP